MVATPLTFGNLLKFGPDSCHNAKDRQIPSSTETEREHPNPHAYHTIISRGAFQWGPACAGAVATTSGRMRARDNNDGFSAPFRSRPGVDNILDGKSIVYVSAPIEAGRQQYFPPRSDRGRASTILRNLHLIFSQWILMDLGRHVYGLNTKTICVPHNCTTSKHCSHGV